MAPALFSGWFSKPASSASSSTRLRVEDENGKVLADIVDGTRADYRLTVDLDSGTVTIDLYPHYQAFAGNGGKKTYHARTFACNTYVKFGACLQDRRELHILIQPVTKKETT